MSDATAPALAAAPDSIASGPNCILGVCCPPGGPAQARALAEHLADGEPEDFGGKAQHEPRPGSYTDIATRVLAEFQLVPLTLEPLPGAPHPAAGKETLERLNRHVAAELRQILIALGHETEA